MDLRYCATHAKQSKFNRWQKVMNILDLHSCSLIPLDKVTCLISQSKVRKSRHLDTIIFTDCIIISINGVGGSVSTSLENHQTSSLHPWYIVHQCQFVCSTSNQQVKHSVFVSFTTVSVRIKEDLVFNINIHVTLDMSCIVINETLCRQNSNVKTD